MSGGETFWLDILGLAMLGFILAGVVIFMTIPKPGKRDFAELGIVLGLTLLIESVVNIMTYTVGASHNNAVYNIFNIMNLPIVVLLYRRRITTWQNKKIAAFIIVPFVVFGLINLFLIQGQQAYNTYTLAVSSVCFISISIIYFFTLIRELPTESITSLPMFWINSAILIYYSGTFFIYLSADYLTNVVKDNMIAWWLLHNFLGLVYYAIFWHALLLIRRSYIQKTR